jgi:serine/threonine protein kinase
MSCVSYEEFKRLYPTEAVIASGGYGSVMSVVGKNYIYKKQLWDRQAFFRDIALMSQFSHPNIMKIEHIAFHDGYGYFSQERGESFIRAFDDRRISLQEVISDVMGAFAFLEKNNIFHGDLKHSNLVFHEGRAKLIDFGLSMFTEVVEINGTPEKAVIGVAYTDGFRDPEYVKTQYNPIRVELYTIAMTVYYMHKRKYPLGLDRVFYTSCEDLDALHLEEDMIDFLMECQEFLENRKSIDELLSHPIMMQDRLIYPYVIELPVAVSSFNVFESSHLSLVFDWYMDVCENRRLSLRCYLHAVALLIRFVTIVGVDTRYLQLQASACLAISAMIFDDSSFDRLMMSFLNTKEEIRNTICYVYTVVDAKLVSKTMYSHISTFAHLSGAIFAPISRNYRSDVIYLTRSQDSLVNRLEFFQKVLGTGVVYRENRVDDYPVPVGQDQEDLSEQLRVTNPSMEKEFDDKICSIVRNRGNLGRLSVDDSRIVLRILIANRKRTKSTELYERLVGDREFTQGDIDSLTRNIF